MKNLWQPLVSSSLTLCSMHLPCLALQLQLTTPMLHLHAVKICGQLGSMDFISNIGYPILNCITAFFVWCTNIDGLCMANVSTCTHIIYSVNFYGGIL